MEQSIEDTNVKHSDPPVNASIPVSEFPNPNAVPLVKSKRGVLTDRRIVQADLTPGQVIDKLQAGDALYLKRSLRSMLPEFLLLGAAIVVFALIILFLPVSILHALIAATIVCLAILASVFHKQGNVRYEIAWDLVSQTTGIRSGTQRTVTLTSSQLRSTEVTQTVYERMLGIGSVKVSDIVPDQNDINMESITHPDFYGEVLRELNQRATA